MRNRKTRPIGVDVRTYSRGDIVVSIELQKNGKGWTSEWWLSLYLEESTALLGTVAFPVYGVDEVEAWRTVGFMVDDVVNFITKNADGEGTLATKPRNEVKIDVGLAHIKAHRLTEKAYRKEEGLITKTTREYMFLANEIGYISAPAVVLAELDNTEVATIKRRVSRKIYGK